MKNFNKTFIAILFTIFISVSFTDAGSGKLLTPEEEQETRGYTVDLRKLLREAEENVKKVDGELNKKKTVELNKKREVLIRECVERGRAFYKEGRLKKADEEWRRALEISQDPDMKDYVRDSVHRAEQEKIAGRREEKMRQKRLGEEKEKTKKTLERLDQIYKKVQAPAIEKQAELIKAAEAAKIIEAPKAEEKKVAIKTEIPAVPEASPAPIGRKANNIVRNLLLGFALILILLALVLKLTALYRPGSHLHKMGPREAKKEKDFEPRELKKYLDKKPKEDDRDLFK